MRSLGSLLISLLMAFELVAASKTVVILSTSKESVFVGEPFELVLKVKRCGSAEKTDVIFLDPKMKHIWIKKAYQTNNLQEGNCHVHTKRYLVSAQQSGLLHIAPNEVKVAGDKTLRDSWGNSRVERSWKSYFSNALHLKVESLPADVTLVGTFTLSLVVESREVRVGEALKTELVIEGLGNFEDIAVEVPIIKGANVFAEEPVLEESGDQEIWRQQIVFTGNNDFAIPSIALEYYDLKAEVVKKIETEAIPIHVIDSKSTLHRKSAKRETFESSGDLETWWIAMVGLVSLLLFAGVGRSVSAGNNKRKVSYRDHKALLHLLLLHKDDEGMKVIIEQLEASVYEGKEMIIAPKVLNQIIKKYQQ